MDKMEPLCTDDHDQSVSTRYLACLQIDRLYNWLMLDRTTAGHTPSGWGNEPQPVQDKVH